MPRTRQLVSHTLAAAAAIALVSLAGAGRGSTRAAQPGDDPAAMQQAVEKWLATTRPNEKHKFLEQFVGEWDTTTRMFFGPGAPPMETKGSATFKMIHGGRFLHQDFTGAMKLPQLDGSMKDVPMTGLGLTGFDNNRKLYTMVWTDNMNTGIMTGTGSLDQGGTILTIFGQMDEPMTGEMGKTVKYVTRIVSPDKHVFEVSEVLYGEPFKVVEVEYNRKK